MFPKNNIFLHCAWVNTLLGLNLEIFNIFASKSSVFSNPFICKYRELEFIGNLLIIFLHS